MVMARVGELKLRADPVRVQQTKKAAWNKARSEEDADFYTAGYSGRSMSDFIEALLSAGVSTVIDVRENPVSMYKPEFSKRNLEASLAAVGIEYVHERSLGVPRDIRSRAVEGDRDAIWEWYDSEVVDSFCTNLDTFFNMANHPVALLCTELDPTSCHRHRLALALERNGLRGYDL
jgi:uncharacterized protein (DUF488 family)